MDLERIQQLLDRAQTKRVLIIGDLMLDEFVWGKVGRISPEAPVPVVAVTGESFYAGGAANVARNLRDFVEQVSVLGMVGKDRSGEKLRELLSEQAIDTSDLVENERSCTIVKTRIVARHQQVVRVDREEIVRPSPVQVEQILTSVQAKLPELDAIIFEDYGKGFITGELVAKVGRESNAAKKIVTADPNRHNLIDWSGMTAVKPNRAEAFLAAGIAGSDDEKSVRDDTDLMRVGQGLLEKWDTKCILVTLGEEGMMLFEKSERPHHIPTKAQQVFDVSGAGDTAIALFTLALTCGATPIEAAQIANYASAVVVGKLGTATVTRQELIASLQDDSK